jgi:hypothetical protein
MSDVVYRSEVRIERVKGPMRRAYLPRGTRAGNIWCAWRCGGALQRFRRRSWSLTPRP